MVNVSWDKVVSIMVVLMLCGSVCMGKEIGKVSGVVTDEKGKPLAGVKWRVSGIEELHEGEWVVVQRLGNAREHVTGEDGRFVLTFHENLRYDLQFDKWSYGPVFLYQISARSPELKVVMKKGIPIRGKVFRLVEGRREPVSGGAVVELRLPNPRGIWYTKKTSVNHEGSFEFLVSPAAELPKESRVSCEGKICRLKPASPQWEVVFAGEIVKVEVEEGKQVEEIEFEVQVRATRKAIEPR